MKQANPSPRMSSEGRRAAIVDAAVRLFAERGFRGTTTRALAEAVGVTEPVLYEHFKSKRELYRAIVQVKSQQGMALAEARVGAYMEARDDRRFFTELAEFILERHETDPDYTRLLLYVALEDPALAEYFHAEMVNSLQLFSEYIGRRIADGAFRPVDPAVAARTFFGMLANQGLWGILYRDKYVLNNRKQIAATMVDIFIKGISK